MFGCTWKRGLCIIGIHKILWPRYPFFSAQLFPQTEFTKAQEASQLTWNVTGKLGKRTKFQTFDVSQLVLDAASAPAKSSEDSVSMMPKNLELEDDVLLEQIQLTNPKEKQENTLSPRDQCILLAFW